MANGLNNINFEREKSTMQHWRISNKFLPWQQKNPISLFVWNPSLSMLYAQMMIWSFWYFLTLFFIFIKLHQHHNGSKLRLIMGREGTVSFPNLATNMRIRKLRDRCCLWIKLHYSNILCIQVVPVDDWWWLTFSKVELHEELVGHTVRA